MTQEERALGPGRIHHRPDVVHTSLKVPNRLDPAVEPSADDWAPAEAATLAGGRSTVSATPIGEEQAGRELVRALSGTPFPADRRRLLADAQRAGVAEPLRQRLGELPADERFAKVETVWRAIAASGAAVR
jgi:Protein of unknown function (DUF2795)